MEARGRANDAGSVAKEAGPMRREAEPMRQEAWQRRRGQGGAANEAGGQALYPAVGQALYPAVAINGRVVLIGTTFLRKCCFCAPFFPEKTTDVCIRCRGWCEC